MDEVVFGTAESLFTLETIDDILSMAHHDLSIMRQPLPLDDILKRHFKNYSEYLYYTIYLLKLYFNNNNNKDEGREKEQFLKWCFKNCWGSQSSQVLAIIIDRKAVTAKEVEVETKASPQLIKHVTDKMMLFGILETNMSVSAGYVNQPGRPPKIFQTSEATKENINDAEHRYALIALGYDPEKQRHQVLERQQQIKREQEETTRLRKEEARQRLIQQHEPLIAEIVEKYGDRIRDAKDSKSCIQEILSFIGDRCPDNKEYNFALTILGIAIRRVRDDSR